MVVNCAYIALLILVNLLAPLRPDMIYQCTKYTKQSSPVQTDQMRSVTASESTLSASVMTGIAVVVHCQNTILRLYYSLISHPPYRAHPAYARSFPLPASIMLRPLA